MEECYVYETFEKRKYDFTSAQHIRRLVHQKDGFQHSGATVSVMLTRTHYRRSPLVKGGLEIPCKVSVSLIGKI